MVVYAVLELACGGRWFDAELREGVETSLEVAMGGGTVAACERSGGKSGVSVFGPAVDLEGPTGQVFGLVGIATAGEELRGSCG